MNYKKGNISRNISNHFKAIDIIRAISAILIVLYHYTYRYNENIYIIKTNSQLYWPVEVSWGWGAIFTFFILSGFLLAKYILQPKVEIRKFLTKRLLRLYPTYWVCMTITTLVLMFLFPEAKVTFKEYVINLTMLASNFNMRLVDGAYWTMAYEIKFTVILSLIFVITQLNWRKLIITVLLLLSIFEALLAGSDNIIFKVLRVVLMIDWVPVFIAGMCIYCIQKQKNNKEWWCLLCLCIFAQLIRFSSIVANAFFIISLMLMYFLPILNSWSIPNKVYKFFEFIALLSYPLYLLHQMIGFTIIKSLKNIGLTGEMWIVIPIAISILMAYLIHRYIEIPTSKTDFKNWPKSLFNS